MNKIIVIEGTDCSGKETQCNLLYDHLKKDNIDVNSFSFPNYDSPTGRIVGGPFLGKSSISESFFKEGSPNVDPKVSSLYLAADRRYHLSYLLQLLNKGHVVLDRYVESNMAYQGSKIRNKEERKNFYYWLEQLEYDLLQLPRPDIIIFLYVPYSYIEKLMKNRNELDANEKDVLYLKSVEETYLELAKLHDYKVIQCIKDGKLKTKEEIHQEIYDYVLEKLKN